METRCVGEKWYECSGATGYSLEIAEILQKLKKQFAQRLLIIRLIRFDVLIHVDRVNIIHFLQMQMSKC